MGTNTASIGLKSLSACGRALMQQYRRRKDAGEFEELRARSGPAQVEHLFVGFMRWVKSAGQHEPAWFRRALPVPVDHLQREQDADLERLLAAASLQPEGALLVSL